MELLGLAMAVLIGLSLGLIGGGGSILTVPVLVYIVGINPLLSVTYSLFIVGMAAFVGAADYYRKGHINLKAALVFTVPSFISVFITRRLILPIMPNQVFKIESFVFTKSIVIMVFFALLMFFSSFSMIHQNKNFAKLNRKTGTHHLNYSFIFFEGCIVGILTGFVGAGGGFLIIPALVLFAKLPMKTAIGTSLFIIAINSLIGFSTDLLRGITIDWRFLISFACFALTGISLGVYLSRHIDGNRLKPAFGWFTLIMGAFIIFEELF